MDANRIEFIDSDETSLPIPALTGITAFQGITERGPINNPKDILYSWEDYQKIFGGLLETSDFPLICKRALDGGAALRVNSIRHYTDITDASTLTATRPAAKPLRLHSATLSTPSGVVATPSTSGGTLAAATYQYRILAVDAYGGKTLASANTEAIVTTGTGSVALTWTAVSGADSYEIFRDGTTYFTSATNSFTDIGGAGTAGTVPTTNTTGTLGTQLATVRPKYAGAVIPVVTVTDPSNGLGSQNWFNINVTVNGKLVEKYENLRITGRPTVNDSKWLAKLVGSNLIEFAYSDLSAIPGNDSLKVMAGAVEFASGSNGDAVVATDYIGDATAKTGYYAFDGYDDFYQIATPEISDEDVHNAGAQYANNRGDCEYWAHLDNATSTVSALITEREEITVDTKYLAIFAGGVKFTHPVNNNEVELSELGDMAAIQAYVDKNFAPWISAANYVRAAVRNVTLGVVNNFGSKGDYSKLNQLTQNQINMMVQANKRVYMSSSVSGQLDDTKASYRNVVRGIIYLKKTLHPILTKYLEEPPTFSTFKALFNEVEPILEDMAERRAFAVTSSSRGYKWMGDQDASTYEEMVVNTKAELDNGNYKVRLELDFLGTINKITIEFALVDSIVTTEVIDNL